MFSQMTHLSFSSNIEVIITIIEALIGNMLKLFPHEFLFGLVRWYVFVYVIKSAPMLAGLSLSMGHLVFIYIIYSSLHILASGNNCPAP